MPPSFDINSKAETHAAHSATLGPTLICCYGGVNILNAKIGNTRRPNSNWMRRLLRVVKRERVQIRAASGLEQILIHLRALLYYHECCKCQRDCDAPVYSRMKRWQRAHFLPLSFPICVFAGRKYCSGSILATPLLCGDKTRFGDMQYFWSWRYIK